MASFEKSRRAKTVTTGETMITGGAGERYARALFELADEAKSLAAVETSVDSLIAVLTGSADLTRALASPVVSSEDKTGVLSALADKLKLDSHVAKFIGVMAANNRAGSLLSALKAFKAMAARQRGTSTAEVTSADKLTATQIKDLQASLKAALGRDIEVHADVDPELIGGLIVKVGSRMFDSSLRTKLNGLRTAMKEA